MYSVIDIGSNTLILGIYQVDSDIKEVLSQEMTLGLKNFIEDSKLNQKGVSILKNGLKSYKNICTNLGIEKIYPFATASLRGLANIEEVLESVEEDLGLSIDLISDEDEARLGYMGLSDGLDIDRAYILDIGGGSTELSYIKDGKIQSLKSVDLGTVKVFASLEKIFPSRGELSSIKDQIDEAYSAFEIKDKNIDLYGIGGNNLHVKALAQAIYDIDTDYIPYSYIKDLRDKVYRRDVGLLKDMAKYSPSRLHLLNIGILMTEKVMAMTESDILYTSESGLKEGYLKQILEDSKI